MNGELLGALERIEREKGIRKEILYSAIESALASAARKVIDDPKISKEEIVVNVNRETGAIEIYSGGKKLQNERFGRIAAQTAKQVIIQKIREAERDVIFDKYLKKCGTIISGSVHRFEKGNIIVELDDTEAVLPKSEQLPKEKFRQGETIRAYLLNVERGMGGPEVVLSRTDGGFVKKLSELEVPEISQGIVEIKSLAREAGERTKIAVYSKDEKIDPVGACVGMRGSRVRDIVKELHGERIDIVRWDDDIREFLPAAVNPAEITRMVIDRENKKVTITVPKDQLSLLIGKKGRNIRLASKLLGWDLVAESEADESMKVPLSKIDGIGDKTVKILEEAGFYTAVDVVKSTTEELTKLQSIGTKTAEKIIAACKVVIASAEDAIASKKAREEEAAKNAVEQPAPDNEEKVISEEDKEGGQDGPAGSDESGEARIAEDCQDEEDLPENENDAEK